MVPMRSQRARLLAGRDLLLEFRSRCTEARWHAPDRSRHPDDAPSRTSMTCCLSASSAAPRRHRERPPVLLLPARSRVSSSLMSVSSFSRSLETSRECARSVSLRRASLDLELHRTTRDRRACGHRIDHRYAASRRPSTRSIALVRQEAVGDVPFDSTALTSALSDPTCGGPLQRPADLAGSRSCS